jgi:hypothetical protein
MSARKQVVVRVDQARFDQVAGILVGALERNEFPYNIARRPQDMVPQDIRADKRKHALLLFAACYFMRGTIQSDFAIAQVVRIYRKYSEIFDPEFLSGPDGSEQYVFERLGKFIQYRLFEIPRIWLDGFRRLQEDWGGDPRNIFAGVHDSAELYRRIVNAKSLRKHKRSPDKMRGFVGAREKIANMLAYFYEDAGIIPEGQVKTSSPFDFHNGRAFISSGGIVLEGEGPFRFEDVTDIGSAAVEAYGIRHGISMRKMSDAFWLISTTNCRRVPGNRTAGRDKRKNQHKGARHKIDYKPRKRAKRNLEFYKPDWSSPRDVRQHELTCGRCPLAEMCSLNVAAGFFYERGEFVTQPRTEPIPHLFGAGGLRHHKPEKKESSFKKKAEEIELPKLKGLGRLKVQKKPKTRFRG